MSWYFGMWGLIAWMMCQPTANAWYFMPIVAGLTTILFSDEFKNAHALTMGGVAALTIILPLSYLHYLDIDLKLTLLDIRWPLIIFSLFLLILYLWTSLFNHKIFSKD